MRKSVKTEEVKITSKGEVEKKEVETIVEDKQTTNSKPFELEEAFVLWRNKSKKGGLYLSGQTSEDLDPVKLIGFFNSNKENPKAPDIRIYTVDTEGKQDKEVCSLWENISKNNTRYLTGITDEKEKVIAFYGDESNESRPYIKAYYKDTETK